MLRKCTGEVYAWTASRYQVLVRVRAIYIYLVQGPNNTNINITAVVLLLHQARTYVTSTSKQFRTSLTRVTKSYLLALGTTQISSVLGEKRA